jgi:hypothetical protein
MTSQPIDWSNQPYVPLTTCPPLSSRIDRSRQPRIDQPPDPARGHAQPIVIVLLSHFVFWVSHFDIVLNYFTTTLSHFAIILSHFAIVLSHFVTVLSHFFIFIGHFVIFISHF